jgi:hypothetical protein
MKVRVWLRVVLALKYCGMFFGAWSMINRRVYIDDHPPQICNVVPHLQCSAKDNSPSSKNPNYHILPGLPLLSLGLCVTCIEE